MTDTINKHYTARIASGQLTADAPQHAVVAKLDDLLTRLKQSKRGFLGIGRTPPPIGLYLWGGVGRGKSMLMDMFADAARADGITTARLHFHDFMAAVHDKIHDPSITQKKDPARHVVSAITGGAQLICFDEMEVRDIADAMIIARVMQVFFDDGGVLVATSNRHPDDLYLNGLHRERFLPFIDLLKEKTAQHEMVSPTDWRQRVLSGMPSWFAPDNAENRQHLNDVFTRLTNDEPQAPITVTVAGRHITIDHTAGNIGLTSFDDLCARPLAARDYIALADRFTGMIIHGVPQFTEELRNESRRFMWLVDAFYDRGRFLVCAAAQPLDDIYIGTSWAHEFPRTRSRLTEMTKI